MQISTNSAVKWQNKIIKSVVPFSTLPNSSFTDYSVRYIQGFINYKSENFSPNKWKFNISVIFLYPKYLGFKKVGYEITYSFVWIQEKASHPKEKQYIECIWWGEYFGSLSLLKGKIVPEHIMKVRGIGETKIHSFLAWLNGKIHTSAAFTPDANSPDTIGWNPELFQTVWK